MNDKLITIKVQVAREDFPNVAGEVELTYLPEAAQAGWGVFLKEVRRVLKIEFIDSIYDKYDKSPVHRTLRLTDGGSYLVRQREESAILEVLFTGKTPIQVSWPVTKAINSAKYSLTNGEIQHEMMCKKVDRLIKLPLARYQEREASKTILEASTVQEIVDLINEVMTSEEAPEESEEAKEKRVYEEARYAKAREILTDKNIPLPSSAYPATRNSSRTYDKNVDVVNLHRQALEALHRMCLRKREDDRLKEELEGDAFKILDFTKKTVTKFMHEIDVVVFALNLLCSLLVELQRFNKDVITIILDCIQAYAPPAPPGHPRKPRRLQPTRQEIEGARAIQEALLLADLMLKEERDELEKQRIALEEEEKERQRKLALRRLESLGRTRRTSILKNQSGSSRRLHPGDMGHFKGKSSRNMSSGVLHYSTSSVATAEGEEGGDEEEDGDGDDMFPDGDLDDDGPRVSAHLLTTLRRRQWQGSSTATRRVSKATLAKKEQKETAAPEVEVKKETEIQPLPEVPGVKFIGLLGRGSRAAARGDRAAGESGILGGRDLGYYKGMGALYSFLSAHPGNVDLAVRLWVHEEVADVGLVSQSYPRAIDYLVWILETVLKHLDDEGGETAERRVQKTSKTRSSRNISQVGGTTAPNTAEDISEQLPDAGQQSTVQAMHTPTHRLPTPHTSRTSPLHDMPDSVILCLAMASAHTLVGDSERVLASRWLDVLNDGSRRFLLLSHRGVSMAGL